MRASSFLKKVSQIKTFCDLAKDMKEEKKDEKFDFDWLFKTDSKLIDMKNDLALIESWFPGKKIRLERLYRGSEDGFNGTAYHAKCNNIPHILNVVESQYEKKFGGYTSILFNSIHREYIDPNAFIFSLTEKKKFELIEP
jgi:hypothetical protein